MTGSLQDTYTQLETSRLEFSTFSFLKELETVAIPRRLDTISEDVKRQTEREKELQKRFQELQTELERLKPG